MSQGQAVVQRKPRTETRPQGARLVPVHIVHVHDGPEDVVSFVLDLGTNPTCIALDLDALKMKVSTACEWIKRFDRAYAAKSKRGLSPTIAVFADKLDYDAESRLLGVGAVIFDRSLTCNQSCQTPDQLSEKLSQGSPTQDASNAAPPADRPVISPEDLAAINAYPPGIERGQVEALLQAINSD